MNRIVTLLGVLILALVIIFNFMHIATDNLLLIVDVGALFVGIGLLTGR